MKRRAAGGAKAEMRLPSEPRRTTVGVFMDWFDQNILAGIARYAAKADWSVIFDCAQVREWSVPERLDGVVCLVGPFRQDVACVKKIGKPTVVLTYGDEGMMDPCHRILMDDEATGRLAAEHFLSLGFRDFLLVGRGDRAFSRARIKGFENRAASRSRSIRHAWLGRGLSARALREPIRQALADAPRPLAVFASSDPVAIHVSRFALDMGIRIPEEAAIIGAGNTPLLCETAPVPLTSVEINHERVGFDGSRMLNRLLGGEKGSLDFPLVEPSGIVTRQSTSVVAVPDVTVARALRFIWENNDRALPVNRLAEYVGVPLTVLETKFRTHLRSTVVAVITRSRVDRAKILLASGGASAKEVAERCGFSSASYFNNVFKKFAGVTPSAYREKASKSA